MSTLRDAVKNPWLQLTLVTLFLASGAPAQEAVSNPDGGTPPAEVEAPATPGEAPSPSPEARATGCRARGAAGEAQAKGAGCRGACGGGEGCGGRGMKAGADSNADNSGRGCGCGMAAGRGNGMAGAGGGKGHGGGMGPGKGMGHGGHAAEMAVYRELLDNHQTLRRVIEDVPGGVVTTTTTTDPALVPTLREHVRQMAALLEEGRPIRRWDPLFAEIFRHHDAIEMTIEELPEGVRVTETSEDPAVTELIRAHARKIDQFTARGAEAYQEATPLPEGYDSSADS